MACLTPVAAPPAGRSARRRVLFIGGSLNQTTMLHRVARELFEHECVVRNTMFAGEMRITVAARRAASEGRRIALGEVRP